MAAQWCHGPKMPCSSSVRSNQASRGQLSTSCTRGGQATRSGVSAWRCGRNRHHRRRGRPLAASRQGSRCRVAGIGAPSAGLMRARPGCLEEEACLGCLPEVVLPVVGFRGRRQQGVAPSSGGRRDRESRVWPQARATLDYVRAATTGSRPGAGSRPLAPRRADPGRRRCTRRCRVHRRSRRNKPCQWSSAPERGWPG
jgi:hypothetical protein